MILFWRRVPVRVVVASGEHCDEAGRHDENLLAPVIARYNGIEFTGFAVRLNGKVLMPAEIAVGFTADLRDRRG